jgi:uncharacterized protein YrzB (UPF0473 family)
VENNSLDGLFIVVNELPVELNILGGMKVKDNEYLVIHNLPALEIGENEYEIFRLHRHEGGHVTIASIEDENEYDQICELWETKVAETEDDS